METFKTLNGYEVEDEKARQDIASSVVELNSRIDTEVEEINSTIDTKVEEINSTIDGINGEINTLNSNLSNKLDNTYNLLIDKLQTTTWGQVCNLSDYTMYIVEILVPDSNIGINSSIHFANSISNHTGSNPFRTYNPNNTAEYLQVCANNDKLLFMTNGNISARITGVK